MATKAVKKSSKKKTIYPKINGERFDSRRRDEFDQWRHLISNEVTRLQKMGKDTPDVIVWNVAFWIVS